MPPNTSFIQAPQPGIQPDPASWGRTELAAWSVRVLERTSDRQGFQASLLRLLAWGPGPHACPSLFKPLVSCWTEIGTSYGCKTAAKARAAGEPPRSQRALAAVSSAALDGLMRQFLMHRPRAAAGRGQCAGQLSAAVQRSATDGLDQRESCDERFGRAASCALV